MLHAPQDSGQFPEGGRTNGKLKRGFAREADEAVQFVDGPVGFDPQVVLPDALPAYQASLPGIAAFGVDAVDRQVGGMEGFVANSALHFIYPTSSASLRRRSASAVSAFSASSLCVLRVNLRMT